MTDLPTDSKGNFVFDHTAPMDVVVAHAVARGAAAFDEFCRQVLLEKKIIGQIGKAPYDLRGADPQQLVTEAKQILWGTDDQPGIIPQVARCNDFYDIRQIIYTPIARLDQEKQFTLSDAIAMFTYTVADVINPPELAATVAELEKAELAEKNRLPDLIP